VEERDNGTMNEIKTQKKNQRERKAMETLCRHCGFHPASPRIAGYCSWDCYDADDESDGEGESEGDKAA
jgi:hypothetical protein